MRIAFLGDSLTEGWPGAAYFPLLNELLPQHDLANRGRAGDTVADLAARIHAEGLGPVDAAFVWVGANDAVIGVWDTSEPGSGWSWPERLARLRAEYEELVDWTAVRAALLVLVRPLILEAEGSLWETRAAEVGEAVGEIAAAHGVCRDLDLGPAFAAARAAGAGPSTTDGVHFTDAGARVVADAFATTINDLEEARS